MLLTLGAMHASAQSTNIAVGPAVLQPSVKRLGMNLGNMDFYDAGQITKGLVFRNPGFEGEIYQSTIRCASGTATTCTDDDAVSAWPTSYWNGATFEIFYGAAQGRTGTISAYSAANGSTTGGTFTLSPAGTAPATGDYMIVRMTVPGNAAAGWWPSTSNNGAITTNTIDLPPGTTGRQTIALKAPTAADSATLAAYFDGDAGRSFLLLNGTFQLSFKAKGTAGSNQIALQLQRIGLATYLNQTVTLTNSWQTYTYSFTAAESGAALHNVSLTFGTVAQDGFFLDDVSLIQTNSDSSNTTAFRDPVVNTLHTLQPGVLRFWAGQLGDTLDNLIADPYGRQRAGYLAWYTSQDDISYGLQEFLQLCEAIGADPWFVVPTTFSTTDASNLIEYLAGASSTPYGSKRAARGHPNPWTLSFNKIHLEFGNEAWNGAFKGGTIEYSAPYGQRAQTIFAAMRANASYAGSSFDLVLGGQAVWAGRNQNIQNNCNNNDSFAVAPYMMNTVNSFSTNEELFGSTFAEPEAYISSTGTAEGVTGGLMPLNQQALQSSSHPVPLTVYEINLSTLSGSITQAALNNYVSSLGAGLAVVDTMLQQMAAGVLIQNLWNLTQYNFVRPDGSTVYLWGAVIDMGVTDLRRPQFLALQMANQAIGSNAWMLQTVHSGANPTWNEALTNTVQLSSAHHLQSYAFSNGTNSSLVVFNLHRTAALPVTFSGPNAPSGNVQITQLTSTNITDTNEAANVVAPVASSSSNFNPSAGLSLPPYSMTVLTWTGASSAAPVISSVLSAVTSTSATITWTTDQAATSQVQFGPTTAYGSSTPASPSLTTSHSAVLTGLTPGTTYDYEVLSANSAGQLGTSANFTFSTTPATAAPPVISNVAATGITNTSAIINWTTDQASSSQVEYGATTVYGLLSSLNSTAVTAHSQTLTGLTPGSTYNYAVISATAAGSATSPNFVFSTPPAVVQSSGITWVGGAHNNTGSGGTPTSLSIPYTSRNGNTLVATCAIGSVSSSIASITDSGSAWVLRAFANNGTGVRTEIWSTSAGGSVASTSVAVSLTAGTPASCAIEEYTGALSIGKTATAQGTSGTWTIALATQDPSNYVVAAIGANSYYGYTATSGTIRQLGGVTSNPGNNYTEIGLCDNTSAAPSTLNCTSVSGSVPWAAAAVELRSVSAGTIPVISGVASSGVTAASATITWTTDQPSSSQVEYGPGTTYGTLSAYSAPLTTSHSVTLTGLTSGATYNYAVISADAAGSATSANFTFTTLATSAPVISGVTVSAVTATSATVAWTTDQPSSSQVQYGTTAAYGTLSVYVSSMGTSHSVNLTGLKPGTAYNFQVLSVNSGGAQSASPNSTFSTTATSVAAPNVQNVAFWGITGNSVTIAWSTDQLSSTSVGYGTTAALGQSSPLQTGLTYSHSVVLTGLASATTYYFVAQSANAANATGYSPTFSFTTLDTNPPAISNVQVNPLSGNKATVSWSISKLATSQVEYGSTTNYGLWSPATALTQTPLVSLGWVPSGTIHYRIHSTDPSGNQAVTPDATFAEP